MYRLCIVIVNYKSAKLVLDCVKSLKKQIDINNDKIVIVDNNSGQENLEILTEGLEKNKLNRIVKLIKSPYNNGFSAGNNIGISAIKASFYLLANSDTIFRPGSVKELIKAIKKKKKAGIIGPRLEWLDGREQISCFKSISPVSELINSAGVGFLTKIFYKYNVPIPTVNYVTSPQWISFACVLIRSEVFEKIGLMDEDFFMYFEDTYFCRLSRRAGFDIVNWPYAHVVHLRGQSSEVKSLSKKKKRLPAYYYKSRSKYYIKTYGYFGLLSANLFWLLGRSFSYLREILTSKELTVSEKQSIDIWKI